MFKLSMISPGWVNQHRQGVHAGVEYPRNSNSFCKNWNQLAINGHPLDVTFMFQGHLTSSTLCPKCPAVEYATSSNWIL
jgi:hypothetical protein